METSNYIYRRELWKPCLTATDHNSFFHSVFGTRTSECEEYFDKSAKFRRMCWSTFLTFFENETMPPSLEEIVKKCLGVNQKFQQPYAEDKTSLAKYIYDITHAEKPVILEEIPILSALENVNVAVFSDEEPELVLTIKANSNILGHYPNVFKKPKDVVLQLKENTFCRLSPVDDDSLFGTSDGEEEENSRIVSGGLEEVRRYKRGCSAGSKGVEFQVNLLTVFFLNAFRKQTSWRLSTENKKAGKFDDIVMELSDKSVVLLQAKFKENRKITFEQLLSVNPRHDEFSLPKYYFSYQEIKTKFHIKNIFICTNTFVDKKCLAFLYRQRVSSESMLYYQDGNYSFKCNDKILPYLMESLNIYSKNILKNKKVNVDTLSLSNMTEFLEKLEFYCNYPSEDDLDEVIDSLISGLKDTNSLWCNISSQDIHIKIMNWFMQSDEYMTKNRAKAMLCEIRSEKYCQMLENYSIIFSKNNYTFTEPKRIFHVVADGKHLLHSIKIFRSLGNNRSRILYVNPDDSTDVQRQVIRAFSLPYYTFLILIWTKIKEESLEADVCNELGDLLENCKYKKVVLVSEDNIELTEQIDLINCSHSVTKMSATLDDLSDDVQEKLLKHKNISFQGYNISLEELFANDITGDFKGTVKSEMLEKLVRGDNIKVGSELENLDEDVARYYINREFKRQGKTRSEIVSMDKIYEVNEQIILIADSAGTGKTTVLTKLAVDIKKKYPHLWVIKIKLNDYTGILRDLLRRDVNTVTIMEFLNYKGSTKVNEFEKFLLSMEGKVILILDGIDEISPDYTGLIVSLITQCQELPNFAKIFLTARPHMTEELEVSFQVKPFFLQPFTKQNQVTFLINFWMHNLKLEDEYRPKCEQYAEALIGEMALWTELYRHRENHFAAVPLQVKMLAEIFKENKQLTDLSDWQGCEEFLKSDNVEPKLPTKMNITKLYQIFIDKKREIYMDKWNPKGLTAASQALMDQFNEECLIFHRMLAVQTILDKDKLQLFSFDQAFNQSVILNTLKIGIIQKINNEFFFVHRTYAEYFVAESLLRELERHNTNKEFQKFFIQEILLNPEYNTIRSFFDSCLQNLIYTIPPNVFEEYLSLVYVIDFSRKRKFNLIHRLAQEGCASTLHFIFKCITFGNRSEVANLFKVSFDAESRNKVFGNALSILRYLIQRYGINLKDESDRTPLHYAAENGHLEAVKFLVGKNADVNCKDRGGFVPLREAVTNGHFEVTKFLIQQRADIKVADRLGHSILFEAIIGNYVNIVAYILQTTLETSGINTKHFIIPYTAAYLGNIDLLNEFFQEGLDINTQIDNGESLIFGAVRGAQLNTIEYLIQRGANVNARDDDGNTALFFVVIKGQLDIVEFLLDRNAHINVKNYDGRTVLHVAASWGQQHIVEFLVNNGAVINTRDSNGYTALFFAAEEGLLDTVEFLVERGAEVNLKNNDKRTALFSAAEQGKLETVKFLVERGADVNFRDSEGCTALFLAAEEGELDTVKYLVECGAKVDLINNDGHSVLHLVTFLRRFEIVKFFVECGANVDVTDKDGRNVLMLAAKEGQLDIVKYFQRVGVDVNISDNNGCSALHLATNSRQLSIITFLLDSGADINVQDNDGWSPLHLAITNCSLEIIEFLIACGANVDAAMKNGRTALFLAVKRKQMDIIRFFVSRLGTYVNVRDNVGRTPLHYAALNSQYVVPYLVEHGADITIKDDRGSTAAMLARQEGHSHLLKYLEKNSICNGFFCCIK